MAGAASKRLLFGRFRSAMPQIRPPWTIPEPVFSEACERCGSCIGNCPQKILVPGHAGYPIADFNRGACTFCGACAGSCAHRCFTGSPGAKPWHIVASVGSACIGMQGVACRLCEDACLTDAIRFRPRLGGSCTPVIDAAACNGCGACADPCPADAIKIAAPVLEEACG